MVAQKARTDYTIEGICVSAWPWASPLAFLTRQCHAKDRCVLKRACTLTSMVICSDHLLLDDVSQQNCSHCNSSNVDAGQTSCNRTAPQLRSLQCKQSLPESCVIVRQAGTHFCSWTAPTRADFMLVPWWGPHLWRVTCRSYTSGTVVKTTVTACKQHTHDMLFSASTSARQLLDEQTRQDKTSQAPKGK